MVIDTSAATIKSEDDFNKAFKLINNNHSSIYEKEQQFISFLGELEPSQNNLYNIIVVLKLHALSLHLNDTVKANKWRSRYNKLLATIKSEKSLNTLDFLLKINQLYNLERQQQHFTAINSANKLLTQAQKITAIQKNYLVAGELNITELDVALLHRHLGGSYFALGNYELAHKSFITTFKIYEQLGNLKGVSASYNNLSLIHWAQKDFQSALEYSVKALKISEQLGDNQHIILKLSNQGIYYNKLQRHDDAIASYKRAINNSESALFPKETLVAMRALAQEYLKSKDIAAAKKIIHEALKLSKETTNNLSNEKSTVLLGELLVLEKEYQQAINLYEGVLPYYQKNNLHTLEATLYLLISKAYQAKQDWQKAFLYYQQSAELQNQLNENAQKDSIKNLQLQYEADNKQKEIDLLQAENKLNILKMHSARSRNFIIIALALSAFIIILLAVSRSYSKKEQQRLALYNKEIKANEKQLMLLSNAFKNTSDGVWITNKDFEIEVINKAYITQTLKNEQDVIGQKVSFAPINGQDSNFAEKLRTQAMINGNWLGELYDERSTGDAYSLELEIEAIKDDNNNIIHYLGVFRDITEKIKIRQQLRKLATHDDLTGLPNRTLLNELIIQSSLNSQRSDRSPTILLLDASDFKNINDTYGHDHGDEVICEIAKRLSSILYSKDVIAHINGAEFCVLVELSDPDYGATGVARKMLSCFEAPFEIKGHSLSIAANIGITRFPEDAKDPQELLRKAALAMIDSKNQQQNNYSFFEQHMNKEMNTHLAQEQSLITAIKNNVFEFYYQPFVNTKTGKISGAEALIRWIQPNGDVIYPDAFIPFAERLGLIDSIDEITIDKVFHQIALWQEKQDIFGPISINLSAKMFAKSSELITLLTSKLTQYNIPPALIKIEITEGMLLEEIEKAITTMGQIKALGFTLSLDDFGTGFSSLNYLKQFPIDILKIDRSFIMDMHKSTVDQSIVRSIIDLAHNLNLSVVAEGVELVEHLALLEQLNCQEYQGYYFSKALPVTDIENLVKNQS